MAKVTIVVEDLEDVGNVSLQVVFDPPPHRPASQETMTAAQTMGANLAGVAMDWLKEHSERSVTFPLVEDEGSGEPVN